MQFQSLRGSWVISDLGNVWMDTVFRHTSLLYHDWIKIQCNKTNLIVTLSCSLVVIMCWWSLLEKLKALSMTKQLVWHTDNQPVTLFMHFEKAAFHYMAIGCECGGERYFTKGQFIHKKTSLIICIWCKERDCLLTFIYYWKIYQKLCISLTVRVSVILPPKSDSFSSAEKACLSLAVAMSHEIPSE